jgi:hypothetical protein
LVKRYFEGVQEPELVVLGEYFLRIEVPNARLEHSANRINHTSLIALNQQHVLKRIVQQAFLQQLILKQLTNEPGRDHTLLVLVGLEGLEECGDDLLDDVVCDLVFVEFVEEKGEIVVADEVVVEDLLQEVVVEGIEVGGAVFEEQADLFECLIKFASDVDVENGNDLGVFFSEHFLDLVLSLKNGLDESHDVDEA